MRQTRRTSQRRMRLVTRTRTRMRMTTKQVYVASAVAMLLIAGGLTVVLNLGNNEKAMAFATGEYRSKATGNWNSPSTWETFNGTTWVPAVATPTSTDPTITIKSGFNVTVTVNVLADQLVVESGATLILNTGVTLTLPNGGGTDMDVFGTYKSAGTTTISAGATIVYENGAKYQHNFTTSSGTIPYATWNTGSTCEVIGYTSNTSSTTGLSQSFYDFTWNCPSQTGSINLAGVLTDVTRNFTIVNTGTGDLKLSSGSANLNIGGDYIQTGGTFSSVNSNGNKDTLFVGGNYKQTGGTIMNAGNANSRTRILFNGGGTKTIEVSGSAVISSAGSSKVCFEVMSGTVLDLANYTIGGYDFTVNSGAGIIIGSAAGISSAGATGNVQGTGARTFSTGADYTYNGSSAQITGTGLPATVHNLTINNSSGVSLSQTVAVSNLLTLTSGKITTGAFEVNVTNTIPAAIVSQSASDYIYGNLRRSIIGAGSYDFPVGTAANYELMNLNLAGITGATTLLVAFVNAAPITVAYPLTSVTVSGTPITDMLNYGYWTLTPNIAISAGTYTVTVSEQGHTNGVANPQAYTVLTRNNASSYWIATNGAHNNATQSNTGTIVTAARAGLTTKYDYGIGFSSGGALPIKLIYFTAKLNDGIVNLEWATAAEVNNNFFTVERSGDGEHFEKLLTRPGAGNSTVNLYYHAKDEQLPDGYCYYRLKQTDYDGHYTYSDIQTVKNGEGGEDGMDKMEIKSIAPNPFSESFKVSFMIKSAVLVDFSLMNSAGQMVAQDKIQAEEGINTYEFLDKYNLKKGIYFVTLVYNDQKITKKVIKE